MAGKSSARGPILARAPPTQPLYTATTASSTTVITRLGVGAAAAGCTSHIRVAKTFADAASAMAVAMVATEAGPRGEGGTKCAPPPRLLRLTSRIELLLYLVNCFFNLYLCCKIFFKMLIDARPGCC
jgi:hypothetical protein